ncbi:MAG: hypothetical protein HYV34_01055 [Candidatus Kerfeldbacteria bacterium]|nr:hypothetical protein [Candidatus Kerfeldbacteria bacterium]
MPYLDNTFKTLDYWAEELAIPLYVISDNQQRPFRDNFLCLQQSNTSRLYFIHHRWEQEARAGKKYFEQNHRLLGYSKKVQAIVKRFQQIRLDPKKRSDFIALTKMFRAWNNVYFVTEAVRLEKFEGAKDEKSVSDFRKIAKLRLTMRELAEKTLFPYHERAVATIAAAHNLKAGDLFQYTFTELEHLLHSKEKVDRKIIGLRSRGFAFWRINGVARLVVGQDFVKIKKWVEAKYPTRGVKEFKGKSAHRGLVRGSVQRIVHNSADMRSQIHHFGKGNILVTEMTRPEIMAICHRARAIITDEGGLTCHAAIIARELNKPCIVGTKIATRVLRNGDTVEVNANTGMVKILKKDSPTQHTGQKSGLPK